MKSVCLIFRVHRPFSLRQFRFFDIGADHYYYDDYANETGFQKLAANTCLPLNNLLLRHIKRLKGSFRVALYLSGVTIDQINAYSPNLKESFRELAGTGCVEFLGGTFSHSLASLSGFDPFQEQAAQHRESVIDLTGQNPGVFFNTGMIYSDNIGAMIADLGYQAVVTEGARHILGWKSPRYLYCNAVNPRLKVMLRDYNLSNRIFAHIRIADKPGPVSTPEEMVAGIEAIDQEDALINIGLPYELPGNGQASKNGFLSFLDHFIFMATRSPRFTFSTPSELVSRMQPVSILHVPSPVSWEGDARDASLWIGNELQVEALEKLYELTGQVRDSKDPDITRDWKYLQSAENFRFMATKQDEGNVYLLPNPFRSPFEAFINYMNILSDFKLRLNRDIPENSLKLQLDVLKKQVDEKNSQIEKYRDQLKQLRHELGKEKKRE